MKYIFDVDGTLTLSRGRIDPEFKEFCMEFFDNNDVYLVSGSDKPKTVEQIGEDLYNKAKIVYNCSGNDVWVADSNIYKSEWKIQQSILFWLRDAVEKSSYHTKTGKHIDIRTGLVNFSMVGRNASPAQRKEYHEYDLVSNDRNVIAFELNKKFGDKIQVDVAGETGVDIMEPGHDKSQILHDFTGQEVMFFGDRTEEGGNDYTIAKTLKDFGGTVHTVKDWKDTSQILKKL